MLVVKSRCSNKRFVNVEGFENFIGNHAVKHVAFGKQNPPCDDHFDRLGETQSGSNINVVRDDG